MTSAPTCPVHTQTSFFVQKGFETEIFREACKERIMDAYKTPQASGLAASCLERLPNPPPPPPGSTSQTIPPASACSKSTNTRSNPPTSKQNQRIDGPKPSSARISSPSASVVAFTNAASRRSHKVGSNDIIEGPDQSVTKDKTTKAILLGPDRNNNTLSSKRSRRQLPYSR